MSREVRIFSPLGVPVPEMIIIIIDEYEKNNTAKSVGETHSFRTRATCWDHKNALYYFGFLVDMVGVGRTVGPNRNFSIFKCDKTETLQML